MGRRGYAYRILVEKPEEKKPFGKSDQMGENIKWILNTIGGLGLGSSGSGQEQVASYCERGNGKWRSNKM